MYCNMYTIMLLHVVIILTLDFYIFLQRFFSNIIDHNSFVVKIFLGNSKTIVGQYSAMQCETKRSEAILFDDDAYSSQKIAGRCYFNLFLHHVDSAQWTFIVVLKPLKYATFMETMVASSDIIIIAVIAFSSTIIYYPRKIIAAAQLGLFLLFLFLLLRLSPPTMGYNIPYDKFF
mmetsp:Transcript_19038/g.41390  ORF Transcript_19038/g.41390 Transcript_19038/m.41390 type:complete len:175 (+) Transcript_19038:294-818(+)